MASPSSLTFFMLAVKDCYHEEILCNWKVRVSGELWPSFIKLVEGALSRPDPKVYWEDPIV
jgi:hypothetical protein